MKESFDIKRLYNLLVPANWKKLLLIGVFFYPVMVWILIAFYPKHNHGSVLVVPFMILVNNCHEVNFVFLTSRDGLSRFLLQPATNPEKFLRLTIGAILAPYIIMTLLFAGVFFISTVFYSNSALPYMKEYELMPLFLFMCVILFVLRLTLRWQSKALYFFINLFVFGLVITVDLILHHKAGEFIQNNRGLLYILLSFILLGISYFQMCRLQLSRIKDKDN